MKYLMIVIAAAASIFCGCEQYEIVMTPTKNGFCRNIKCTALQQKDIDRLKLIYPNAKVEKNTGEDGGFNLTAKREFTQDTPQDAGGFGRFFCYSSVFGKTYVYCEQFQGSNDMLAQVDRTIETADAAVTIIRDWAKTQYSSYPQYDKLDKFLDTTFRRDMRNLMLVLLQESVMTANRLLPGKDKDSDDLSLLVRLAAVTLSEGYFDRESFLQIMNGIPGQPSSATTLEPILRVILTNKAGINGPLLEKMCSDAKDATAFMNSIKRSIVNSPGYEKYVKKKESLSSTTAPASKPAGDTDIKLSQQYIDDKFGAFMSHSASMCMTLKLEGVKVAPLITNGQWDKKSQTVTWSGSLNKGDTQCPPGVAMAIWEESNEEFQTKHFGKVLVADMNLQQMNAWLARLPEKSRKEYLAFVKTLTPETLAKIETFRFTGNADTEENRFFARLLWELHKKNLRRIEERKRFEEERMKNEKMIQQMQEKKK